jgi:ATP-dependent Zn protease
VEEAGSILKNHRQELDQLADLLCEQETVDGSQIEAMLIKVKTGDPIAV